jgi:hypothetical protein
MKLENTKWDKLSYFWSRLTQSCEDAAASYAEAWLNSPSNTFNIINTKNRNAYPRTGQASTECHLDTGVNQSVILSVTRSASYSVGQSSSHSVGQ